MRPNDESGGRLRIVYDEVRDQVDGQLRNIDAHDAKAGILTALSGGLFAALIAVALSPDLGKRGHGELTLLVLAGTATAFSIGAALFGLWPRRWHRDPEPSALIDRYEKGDYPDADALLRQLVGNLRGNYRSNLDGITAKGRAVLASLIALVVGILMTVGLTLAHVASW